MNCTLRQTSDGIIATVDELKVGMILFSPISKELGEPLTEEEITYIKLYNLINCLGVIASTFGIGKKLVIKSDEYLYDEDTYNDVIDAAINQEYPYTENENNVIIEL